MILQRAVRFFKKLQASYAELVLTCVATGWGLLLCVPGPSFLAGSGFAAFEELIGGEAVLATVISVLATAHWGGLLVESWPPVWRKWTAFITFTFWTMASVEGLVTRFQSPSWVTTCGFAWLAMFVFLALDRQITRCEHELAQRGDG